MLRYLLIVGLSLLPLANVFAQSAYTFQNLKQADGLSQSFITQLGRSSDGFVWVGTQVGLDRFDGQEIRRFRAARGDASSLPANYIWVIEEGPDGKLWIGTDRGLCRYDPLTESFRQLKLTGDERQDELRLAVVHTINWDESDQMWVGTDQGFWPFDQQAFDYEFSTVHQEQLDQANIKLIKTIHPISDQRLLLGTSAGPFLYHHNNRQLIALLPEGPAREWSVIHPIGEDNFLVGTEEGLLRFHLANNSLQDTQQFLLSNTEDGAANSVTDILDSTPGNYLIGTNSGLFEIDWSQTVATIINRERHDPDRESSLASDRVQCLHQMDENWIWIGTRHGISRQYTGSSVVSAYSQWAKGDDFCTDDIKGMAVSPSGRYLILGGNEGLNLMDIQTGNVRCLNQANFPDLRNEYIINVEAGPEPDSYWLCFRRGGADLLRGVDSGELRIEPVIYPAGSTSGTGVYQVVQGPDGRQWMATGRGLYCYDPKNGSRKTFAANAEREDGLPHEYLFSLTFDHQGQLWIGGARGGLSRLDDEEEEIFTNWQHDPNEANSLIHNMILHTFADQEDRIWMSTPSGISVLLQDGSIRSFNNFDGLPSDLVFGIMEDANGALWINTTGGLIKAQLSQDEESLEILEIFNTQDDLTGGRAQYGWMLLPDGQFALAGGGLNIFHPDSLYHRNQGSSIVLTELQLFNEPIAIGPESSLPVALPFLDQLVLSPGQNFPGFNFSALNLHPNPPSEFSYRLLGMHNDWISTQRRRWVGFPHLRPGSYELQVRSGGVAGVAPGPITTLPIVLRAPWYQRWWAYCLYGLFAFSLVYAWRQQSLINQQRVEAARIAEREAFRRRSARDFHDESGNYLTRLSLLTEVVRRQINGDQQLNGLLNQLDHNVQDLREGMRDFIWALDPGNDNVYELGLRLKRFGQELFTHHPARFIVNGLSTELQAHQLRTDQRRHLLLLFKEAMHNSLKHARKATEVRLQIDIQDGQLLVSWTDNGPGFLPASKSNDGSGLKNMQIRAEKIEGQLQLSSDPSGSKVSLLLPLQLSLMN
ncbi:MAG: two-component regulator propeller domain-containing protein [Bacteroidota bacterium]